MIGALLFVTFFVHLTNGNTFTMPVPKFEAFRPSGIRVTLPDTQGISEFFFWANINEELGGKDLGKIMLSTYEPTNGVWLIEDMDVKLQPGDTIYYTFFVNINSVVHRYERQQYTVSEIIERPTTETTPTSTTTTTRPTTETTPTSTTTTTTTTKTPIPPSTTSNPIVPDNDPVTCFDDNYYIEIAKEYTKITKTGKKGRKVVETRSHICDSTLRMDLDIDDFTIHKY